MSSIIKDRRGRHVWDGVKEHIPTSFGHLEVWKTGENGGGSEQHHAFLRTHQEVPAIYLINLAKEHNLRQGDCVESILTPRPIYGHNKLGVAWVGYEWLYWPSTN